VEFVHEIASNSDNYQYLVRLALDESDLAVREAAINALFWHFPASEIPVQAWLAAPLDLQTKQQVLASVYRELEDGNVGDVVLEMLRSFDTEPLATQIQIELALSTSDVMSPRALDAILARLTTASFGRDQTRLLELAQRHAPARLLSLAQQLAFQDKQRPEWVKDMLRTARPEVRTELFDRAWNQLLGDEFKSVHGEVFGPLANRTQINNCVSFYTDAIGRQSKLTETDRERIRRVEDILIHTSGPNLLAVVIDRAPCATYADTAAMLELVLRHVERAYTSRPNENPWFPTIEKVETLIRLVADKPEGADVPQEEIRILLTRIASYVDPAHFAPFMLDTCRRFLDAWRVYYEVFAQWNAHRNRDRPNNPHHAQGLMGALARWGLNALPGVIALSSHSNWQEFLPEAIARVVHAPWAAKFDRSFSSSVSGDISDGENRRALGRQFMQPDDVFQNHTDQAAVLLARELAEAIDTGFMTLQEFPKERPRVEYRVRRLTAILAFVPSSAVIEPVSASIASGLLDIRAMNSALRGLLSQGYQVSEVKLVRALQDAFDKEAGAAWHDDSKRYLLSEASLLLCVLPESLRCKPLKDQVAQWRRFAFPSEIVRQLGATHSDAAWPALLEVAKMTRPRSR
jgi:hypothetical protein